jgi:hypothetical protein
MKQSFMASVAAEDLPVMLDTYISLVMTFPEMSLLLAVFIRSFPACRQSVDEFYRELSSLTLMLNTAEKEAKNCPSSLRATLTQRLDNCLHLAREMKGVVERHSMNAAASQCCSGSPPRRLPWIFSHNQEVQKLSQRLGIENAELDLLFNEARTTLSSLKEQRPSETISPPATNSADAYSDACLPTPEASTASGEGDPADLDHEEESASGVAGPCEPAPHVLAEESFTQQSLEKLFQAMHCINPKSDLRNSQPYPSRPAVSFSTPNGLQERVPQEQGNVSVAKSVLEIKVSVENPQCTDTVHKRKLKQLEKVKESEKELQETVEKLKKKVKKLRRELECSYSNNE